VRECLAWLILEGIRVHRLDVQSTRTRECTDLRRAVGLIPRDVQGDAWRRSHQSEQRGAVVDLLEKRARLARTWEPRASSAARAHGPGRRSDAERADTLDQMLDVDVAARELSPQRREILVERRFRLSIFAIEQLV